MLINSPETNAAIMRNLEVALEIVNATDEAVIELNVHFFNGEKYCLAGLLTTSPHFQALGLGMLQAYPWDTKLTLNGRPFPVYADDSINFDKLNDLFGPYAFNVLFSEAFSEDTVDVAITNSMATETQAVLPTDKELAIGRIKHQLNLVSHF